ncbi:MAG: WHG domain-containing protein [Acidimicrobiia bacterium]|nr:WHG domain-containing protein [Acidimicrobiia bacterium]
MTGAGQGKIRRQVTCVRDPFCGVAVKSTTNLANAIRDAAVGIAGDQAMEAIGTAYRTFAHTNPGQFASTFLPPLSDNDDLAAANRSLLDVFVLVYRAMGSCPTRRIWPPAARAARSTASAPSSWHRAGRPTMTSSIGTSSRPSGAVCALTHSLPSEATTETEGPQAGDRSAVGSIWPNRPLTNGPWVGE